MIYTIGHSTRSLNEFQDLLTEFAITQLVDVRRFPASKRHPQFAKQALESELAAIAVTYIHEPALGGRRSAAPHSPNTAWRNPQFRGYADYMETTEFQDALERLVQLGSQGPTAIMCAEAVPWRCHRQLIADALVARGIEVQHVLGTGAPRPHVLHGAAKVDERHRVTYPGVAPSARERDRAG